MTNREKIKNRFNQEIKIYINNNKNYQKSIDNINYSSNQKQINTSIEDLQKFGELQHSLTKYPQRKGINPKTQEKVIIPAQEFISYNLRIPKVKNQEFIDFIKHKINSDQILVGGNGPRYIIFDNGKVFDTNINSVDEVIKYCEDNGRDNAADYLSEVMEEDLYKKLEFMKKYSFTMEMKKKYEINKEAFNENDFCYFDNLTDEDIDKIITGENIK